MIKVGSDSFIYQQLGRFFGFPPTAYVYDCTALYPVQDVKQFSVFIIGGADNVCQVFPFETHTEYIFPAEVETFLYVFHHFGGGGSGQC